MIGRLGGLMVALRVFVLTGLGIIASGCINSASLIRVKPDGSGTIEQTTLVNLAAVKGMMAGMGAAAGKEAGDAGLNEADFKRAGERMGVRPVSITPVKEGNFQGQKAIYAFDDITKIRVDQDPQMSGSTSGRFASATGSKNPIRFGLTRQGGTSVLTISVDEKIAAEASSKAQQAPSLDQIDPAMMQMIKTMFDGFRVAINLEVDGKIVKTNADYVEGSRITLLEVDMASVLAEQDKLSTLQSQIKPGTSLSELRPYLKDLKGVKVNHPSVTVEYR
jgi:hypothetical protein